MTISAAFAGFVGSADEMTGLPDAEVRVAPTSIEHVEQILDLASEHGLKVLIWGGGTHQGYGGRIDPDIVVSTAHLDHVVDWQPDDLTATVGGGMRVVDLEAMLLERQQTAVLPEMAGEATVGGVLAAAASGWRRARYGATRERILEVTMVTGDGRRIRAGGRVVKNVTGFDLPRLSFGSFGSLGLIAEVCLKLWPVPTSQVTVTVEDGDDALRAAYRPTAVVETDGVAKVFLGGTEAEVDDQVAALGGDVAHGWAWETDPVGPITWSLRVPPASTRSAIDAMPDAWRYKAGLGVGEIRAASETADGASDLRSWAEHLGGALVVAGGPADLYETFDPWGSPPAGLDIQRRLRSLFDPCLVLNPGRLPGGV